MVMTSTQVVIVKVVVVKVTSFHGMLALVPLLHGHCVKLKTLRLK